MSRKKENAAGVWFNKQDNKWRVSITIDQKQYSLSSWRKKEDAEKVAEKITRLYQRKIKQLYG